ncbi:GPO family capsid scaffolding protein [Pelistega sp. MC2]|uniref:GPO family capsid scaffolding protein n=1 Tax=Pelistega sp. MC2 TaxID=1720297 RepID=UPI0008D8D7D0|nr:GPO family capsid scaffolding protein [Pelistega sp. MC2]
MGQKTKFFRVATEGATADGRRIERSWIEQMAKNYNPEVYGARVWLEHLRGVLPDGIFKAQGDVLALEAREVEDGKLALFAAIDPTDELVQTIRSRQKIYTSIEVSSRFADSNEAYLTGLAVTDSPASLGTEMLKFSLTGSANDRFTTEVEETVMEFDVEDKTSFLDKVKAMFSVNKKEQEQANEATILQALDTVSQEFNTLEALCQSQAGKIDLIEKQYNQLYQELESLKTMFNQLPEPVPQRELSTGGNGYQTDC